MTPLRTCRSVHRSACAVAVAFAFVVLAAPARAQLQPAPETGLWESRHTVLVNGRDMMADLRAQQAEMLKQLPPAQRAQMEAMMKQHGASVQPVHQQCITAKDLKEWADPNARLREMEREAPQCRYEPAQVSGSTLRFKGRCQDPEGFTGDVGGTLAMQGPRAWTSQIVGKGRMQGMPGTVEMRMEGTGRWLSAQCGAVKPG